MLVSMISLIFFQFKTTEHVFFVFFCRDRMDVLVRLRKQVTSFFFLILKRQPTTKWKRKINKKKTGCRPQKATGRSEIEPRIEGTRTIRKRWKNDIRTRRRLLNARLAAERCIKKKLHRFYWDYNDFFRSFLHSQISSSGFHSQCFPFVFWYMTFEFCFFFLFLSPSPIFRTNFFLVSIRCFSATISLLFFFQHIQKVIVSSSKILGKRNFVDAIHFGEWKVLSASWNCRK